MNTIILIWTDIKCRIQTVILFRENWYNVSIYISKDKTLSCHNTLNNSTVRLLLVSN